MKAVLASLLAGLALLAGCATTKAPTPSASAVVIVEDPLFPGGFALWAPCTQAEADDLTAKAIAPSASPQDALSAAGCLASLASKATDTTRKAELAESGRTLALTVAASHPDSPLAHYLAAGLSGYVAESAPLRGLSLVPVIEREGEAAAKIDPYMDHAGPDRLLGMLYLRAPSIPVSVGDSAKAVSHLERAVKLAPDFAENRFGLAEALLEDEEPDKACLELTAGFKLLAPTCPEAAQLPHAADLLKTLCGQTAKP